MTGNGTLINFNDNPITISFRELGAELNQTNTTVSDKDGNLLFYTNGCYISDVTNNVMMNGDILYCTTVDMSLNNGLGRWSGYDC